MSDKLYIDPKNYFKIIPPEDWSVDPYKADPRGKVDFNYSNGGEKVQLKIVAAANPFRDFDELFQDCRNGVERLRARLGGTYVVEVIQLCNTQAVLIRSVLPNGFKQYQVQLLAECNYYTMAFGGDQVTYDRYLPLGKKAIETFEPLPHENREQEARAHIAASKTRLSQLYILIGRKDWVTEVAWESRIARINIRFTKYPILCRIILWSYVIAKGFRLGLLCQIVCLGKVVIYILMPVVAFLQLALQTIFVNAMLVPIFGPTFASHTASFLTEDKIPIRVLIFVPLAGTILPLSIAVTLLLFGVQLMLMIADIIIALSGSRYSIFNSVVRAVLRIQQLLLAAVEAL